MPRPSWPLADDLSEVMVECLFAWPGGHFTEATRLAIMRRGLANRSYGNKRTALGDRVVSYLQEREPE